MGKKISFHHWRDARDWPLKYFSPEEVADSRDGSLVLDLDFGRLMDDLRREAGIPIIVNSWYRTPEHNAAISSTGRGGPHTTGAAADIRAHGEFALWLIATAYDCGIRRIGVRQKGAHGGRFIHLDALPGPQAIWTY